MPKNHYRSKPLKSAAPRHGALRIYTDGSCLRNPAGPGGWAFAVCANHGTETRSGHEPSTTNNRMEIAAVLEALQYCYGRGCAIDVYTDSDYVRCACSSWISGWKKRGWRRKEGELKNVDLWQQVDIAMRGLDVTFLRVPGHSGNLMNELCDQLAGDAARGRCVNTTTGRANTTRTTRTKPSENRQPEAIRKIVFYYMDDPEPMSSFTEDVLVGV